MTKRGRWPQVQLQEICHLKQWQTVKKTEMTEAGYPVYGANGIIGRYHSYNHAEPTIVIGCRGSCGGVHVTEPHSWVTGNAMALDDLDTEVVDLRFLVWALKTDGLKDAVTGTSQPQITQLSLRRIHIPLPPIEEQRRIVAVLDSADAIRAKRNQAIGKLDTLSQAVFIQMFGDPSSAEGDWAILDELVRDGDTINYGVVQPGDQVANGRPLIRVGDLAGGRVDHSSIKYIDPAIDAKYRRSKLVGDEILISCVGSTGAVALATAAEAGWNIARAVARVPLSASVRREYVAAFLGMPFAQRYFANELRTVSQPTLNIKQIRETPVRVPSASEQDRFVGRIAHIDCLRSNYQRSLSALDSLFASLQQRAFRGEL
jgi:type I restriction enzyme S subunit